MRGITTQHDFVDIVGIDLDEKSRRSLLSVAYLSLRVQLAKGQSRPNIDFATLLNLLPILSNRVLIQGVAGSGKSTLTRWAAIEMAKHRLYHREDEPVEITGDDLAWAKYVQSGASQDDGEAIGAPGLQEASAAFRFQSETADTVSDRREGSEPDKELRELQQRLSESNWRQRIPFLIPLRHAKTGLNYAEFPKLSQRHAGTIPDGWLDDLLATQGHQILLIFDGLDEVPVGEKRRDMLNQINDIARLFGHAQIIVTTRPGAVPDDALADFCRVDVQDLDDQQVNDFTHHWHQALAINAKRSRHDAILKRLADAAQREIDAQVALKSLAHNPLLLASICALHWLRRREVVEEAWQGDSSEMPDLSGSVLPNNIWNLAEDVTRMLVHQRDLDRPITDQIAQPEYRLDYLTKRECLAKIADRMVADEFLSSLSRKEAIIEINEVMALGEDSQKLSSEIILRALTERSGVLRESGENDVEFIHNTIKAYLAAKAHLSRRGSPTELLRRIQTSSTEEILSGVDEVALFAAASPDHAEFAQRFIEGLTTDNWLMRMLSTRAKRERKRLLGILAVRAAARAKQLPAELRAKTRALGERLLPPVNYAEARQLAALGAGIAPKLAFAPDMPEAVQLACVQCLKLMGEAVNRTLLTYNATGHLSVAHELTACVPLLEITAVLNAVQSYPGLHDAPPGLAQEIKDLSPLLGMTALRMLYLRGTGVSDISVLQGMTALRMLDLRGTGVSDISVLQGMTALENLDLRGTGVSDISVLQGMTALRMLDLRGTGVRDISVLQGMTALRSLDLRGTGVRDISVLRGNKKLTIIGP